MSRGLAPLPLLSFAVLGMLLAVVLATWYTVNQPWLGLTLGKGDALGPSVQSVYKASPASRLLQVGDKLTHLSSFSSLQQQRESLAHYDPAFNPHAATTFQGYNDYMQRQGRVADLLQQPQITLERVAAPNVVLTPAPSRPLSSLPIGFWLLNLFGIFAAMVSLSVWVFKPKLWAARLLALSGTSFFLATLQHSIWQARELALPAPVFDALMRGNHVFLHLLLVSLMILMVIYPNRLKRAPWLIAALLVFVLLEQFNENLQLMNLPLHSHYIALLIYYLAGVLFAVIQWRQSRANPTDRGMLRWVFLSILLAMGGGMLVYFLPTMLGSSYVASLPTMVGIASTLYVGFAFGILRYRLFEIERWWFLAWAWFLGGLFVLLVDFLVVMLFQIQQQYALSLALVLVGWLYFPLRQWLWHRLNVSMEVSIEQHLPSFVEALFTSEESELPQRWRLMLDKLFQPLSLQTSALQLDFSKLGRDGQHLWVPALNKGEASWQLMYGQKGRRLFNSRDLLLANALLSVASCIINLREAKRQAMEKERKRIMRDLHDDVGGRLLTLIHTAKDAEGEGLARGALAALRETLYAMDENRRYNLEELFAELHTRLSERLAAAALTLDWQLSLATDNIHLPPRYYINLSRVLDEAITNASQYGEAVRVIVQVDVLSYLLHIDVINVIRADVSQTRLFRGRGLNNMRTRIEELGGELDLFCHVAEPRTFHLQASIPLPPSADHKKTATTGSLF